MLGSIFLKLYLIWIKKKKAEKKCHIFASKCARES